MNVNLDKTPTFTALRTGLSEALVCHFAFRNVRSGAGHRGRLDDEHARFLDIFAVSALNSRVPALLPLYSAGRGFGGHG
jgi:hypothetical protein